MNTIRDLAQAVRSVRPDLTAVGVTITDEHVLAARHERGVRYEDITDDDFDAITERAVSLALASHAADGLGRRGGKAGTGASKRIRHPGGLARWA